MSRKNYNQVKYHINKLLAAHDAYAFRGTQDPEEAENISTAFHELKISTIHKLSNSGADK